MQQAQRLAAQAFGARKTYFATNGTSTSNKVIFQTLLAPGDKLLLCSDGLWGALDDDTITRILAEGAITEAAPDLVERALRIAGEKSDNVTVIAVEWESAEDDETLTGIETDALGDDVFASTIQAGAGVGNPDDLLDEAEIERSIREINEAIQRSAQKRS